MCGRFSLAATKEQINKVLPQVILDKELIPNYNIAPTQYTYILAQPDRTHLQLMQWGLIPHWSKEGNGGTSLINARVETIVEKASFKGSIHERKCVVLADSFYEWRTEGKLKIPYRIQMPNNELLLMGGIWDSWQGINTFSIITTEPNAQMSRIHNRMPVILRGEDDVDKWLTSKHWEDVLYMCQKPQDDFLITYRVSEKVNSVKNNSPDMHKQMPESLRLFD